MALAPWFTPGPRSAWTSENHPGLRAFLESSGFGLLSDGALAANAFGVSGHPAVGVCLSEPTADELLAVRDILMSSSLDGWQRTLMITGETNRPLAVFKNPAAMNATFVSAEYRKWFSGAHTLEDDLLVAWFMDQSRREMFQLRRIIRVSGRQDPELGPEPRGAISITDLMAFPLGAQVHNFSIGGHHFFGCEKRALGGGLSALGWRNARLLIQRSRLVGKELIVQSLQRAGEGIRRCHSSCLHPDTDFRS